MVVDREKGFRQRGDEATGVVGAAVGEGAQVDTGGETAAGTGEDDRSLDAAHRGDDDFQQVQVERVDRRIIESDYRHAVGCLEICHVSSDPRTPLRGRAAEE